MSTWPVLLTLHQCFECSISVDQIEECETYDGVDKNESRNEVGFPCVPPFGSRFQCSCAPEHQQLLSSGREGAPGILECQSCGAMRCQRCQALVTSNHQCSELTRLAIEVLERKQMYEERAKEFAEVKKLSPLGIVQCPRCKEGIQKSDDGCDHMRCTCGHDFCFLCGQDRRVILAHGNHYHRPSCRYYFECDVPDDFKEECPQCKATGKTCKPPRLWLPRCLEPSPADAGRR